MKRQIILIPGQNAAQPFVASSCPVIPPGFDNPSRVQSDSLGSEASPETEDQEQLESEKGREGRRRRRKC